MVLIGCEKFRPLSIAGQDTSQKAVYFTFACWSNLVLVKLTERLPEKPLNHDFIL